MTRYYYDDPLAAAWMAKHFKMTLTTESGAYQPGWQDLAASGSFSPYFIHPDSLHLLEPKKGDLVHIVRGFCSHYKNVDDIATGGGKVASGIWCDGEHWDITSREPLHDWEIIKREGLAFQWPFSEAT